MICNTYKAELRVGHTDKFLVWTQVDGGSLSGSKVFVEVPGVGNAVLVKLTNIRNPLTAVTAKNGQRVPATVWYAEATTIGPFRKRFVEDDDDDESRGCGCRGRCVCDEED